MSVHQIHIFISHAWAYTDHYETLASWIFHEKWSFGQASLNFHDYSIPKCNPIHNASTSRELKEAIYRKISRSHVIVIPSGMYTNYSKWIKKEIAGAHLYNKPILAVNPFGQQRKAGIVLDNSTFGVGWNKKTVISGIWQLYYNKNL